MDVHRGYAPHTTAPGSQTGSMFGHADYHHAQGQGKSASEIANWARANTATMGNGGVGGGLWNEIMAAEAAAMTPTSGGGGGGGYSAGTVGAGAGAFDPSSIDFNPGGIDMGGGFSESDYVMGLAKERAENFVNENSGGASSTITNNIEQNVGNKGDTETTIGDGNTINSSSIGNDYSLNMGSINLANKVGQY